MAAYFLVDKLNLTPMGRFFDSQRYWLFLWNLLQDSQCVKPKQAGRKEEQAGS